MPFIGRIVQATNNMILNGKGVAYDGCLVACGCESGTNKIIATKSSIYLSPEEVRNLHFSNNGNYTIQNRIFHHKDGTYPYLIYSEIQKEQDDEELLIVVNSNTDFAVSIGHVGFFIGKGSNQILYDPNGSYDLKDPSGFGWVRGTGDYFFAEENSNGFDIDDYLKYQFDEGSEVEVYKFFVPKKQADLIRELITDDLGFASCGPLGCANCTLSVLKQSGNKFSKLEDPLLIRRPIELGRQLKKLIIGEL